jgi:hypothetical protein
MCPMISHSAPGTGDRGLAGAFRRSKLIAWRCGDARFTDEVGFRPLSAHRRWQEKDPVAMSDRPSQLSCARPLLRNDDETTCEHQLAKIIDE